jgi:tail assembly chaperone E/41/14-like protein
MESMIAMTEPAAREGFQPPQAEAPSPPAVQNRGNGPSPQPPQSQLTPVPAPAPAPAPVQRDEWPIRVKLLYKPIRGMNSEELKELVFREPTGGDINRYGNPCRIDSAGEVMIDEIKMTRIMAALSGLLPPLIDFMDPRDWNSCAFRLRNFFLPDLAAW